MHPNVLRELSIIWSLFHTLVIPFPVFNQKDICADNPYNVSCDWCKYMGIDIFWAGADGTHISSDLYPSQYYFLLLYVRRPAGAFPVYILFFRYDGLLGDCDYQSDGVLLWRRKMHTNVSGQADSLSAD